MGNPRLPPTANQTSGPGEPEMLVQAEILRIDHSPLTGSERHNGERPLEVDGEHGGTHPRKIRLWGLGNRSTNDFLTFRIRPISPKKRVNWLMFPVDDPEIHKA